MLKLIAVFALAGTTALAKSENCTQARNLSANYWSAVNGLAEVLTECEGDTSKPCEAARKADAEIKETGSPNGTMLLMTLPVQLCQ